MKKRLINFLKIVLPLLLGAALIYIFYGDISEEEKESLLNSFSRANYTWVWISTIPAILSHMSRAYRWKYTIRPLGHEVRFINGFLTVMIGYLVNLAVPRLGELSRCVSMSRVEKIPLEKLIGTVIAERVADLIMLISFITAVTLIQYDYISGFLKDTFSTIIGKVLDKIPGYSIAILLLILSIAGIVTLVKIYKSTSENKIIVAIRGILKGVIDGVLSIITMKDKWYFLFHTLFIWTMYVAMFWFCIYALPETAALSPGAIVSGFVLGGIAMVVTNGGIGAYPVAIQSVFLIYNIEESVGGAIGWIMWTAQTLLVIALGGLSFALLPFFNKNNDENVEVNAG